MDPFANCREELCAKLDKLERHTKVWREVVDQSGTNAQWMRQMVEENYDAAVELRDVIDQSCKKIAIDPAHFNVTLSELQSRQRFVEQCSQRLRMVEVQLSSKPEPKKPSQTQEDRYRMGAVEDNQRFIDREMQQQQELIQKHEMQLDHVVTKTGEIRIIAGIIEEELESDKHRLDDMDRKMDKRQSELDDTIDKMRKFLKKKSTWLCIGCIVLTVIVIVMIVWVFVG
jgi:flagellar capping protein FliD